MLKLHRNTSIVLISTMVLHSMPAQSAQAPVRAVDRLDPWPTWAKIKEYFERLRSCCLPEAENQHDHSESECLLPKIQTEPQSSKANKEPRLLPELKELIMRLAFQNAGEEYVQMVHELFKFRREYDLEIETIKKGFGFPLPLEHSTRDIPYNRTVRQHLVAHYRERAKIFKKALDTLTGASWIPNICGTQNNFNKMKNMMKSPYSSDGGVRKIYFMIIERARELYPTDLELDAMRQNWPRTWPEIICWVESVITQVTGFFMYGPIGARRDGKEELEWIERQVTAALDPNTSDST